ncbi:DUF4054 domain-containing protein, partial [Providencia manganoxydans]|uniref:DUF4054 domain-containing protein n=1 Tax=Providencia manganoxydans TaxID=2923283 RepID=UPI0032DA2611
YHQTNQKTNTGKTLKPWPILVDHYSRASSASEGSVSVSLDYGPTTNAEKWYTQTPYGAEYWQMTSKYRSFLYTLGVMPMPVWRGGYYV